MYSCVFNKRVAQINVKGVKQPVYPKCFSIYCYVVTNKRESMEKYVKELSLYTCCRVSGTGGAVGAIAPPMFLEIGKIRGGGRCKIDGADVYRTNQKRWWC